ncbi:phosphatidylglycerophosphatase A [soil metagenome]
MAAVVASFFGSGLVLGRMRGKDGGSGTVGALVAGLIAYVIPPVGGRLIALGVVLLLGAWALRKLGLVDDDPGWVVIDEAAGTFLATIGLGPIAMVAAFIVFRVADIAKRWFPGVAAAEALGGPLGIMGDDLVAGLYGLGVGWIVQGLVG